MSLPRLFLDACVIIAAAASSRGASALVLEMGKEGRVRLLATQRILQEAERNIRLKLSDDVLVRFYQQIADAALELSAPAGADALSSCGKLIDPKDAHVLAAALQSGAGILLTLDRKHFLTPRLLGSGLNITIQTPGEFVRQWALEH